MPARRTVAALGAATLAALGAIALSAAPASSSVAAARPAQLAPQGSPAADRVLVQFTTGATKSAIAGAVSASGATEVGQISALRVHVLRVPAGAAGKVATALSRNKVVTFAEADGLSRATTTPNDTYWPQQWGPAKVNAAGAWDSTTGAASTVVAVLDTGVYFGHPDLQGRFAPGYDFINNDTDPSDDNGHGTQATGIIGATSNNGTGIAGMCWSCTLMPVKVLDSTGSGSWSAIASGITWATDHGAKVISMSLGGTSSSSTLQSAVNYALNHDVVVLAAAGNNGSSAPFYPAAYAGVVSVAATQSDDTLYSWSDYGSWVSVAAPGCDYATLRSGGYAASFCGTSAATPVVAGIVGLERSMLPTATRAQVISALEASAVGIGAVVAYGRVDAAAAVAALAGTVGAPAPSPSPSPTASPTASASPSPTPSTTTTTFSGSLTAKATSRSYGVSSGAGQLRLQLSFTKSATLTVTVRSAAGQTVLQVSGGSPLPGAVTVAAGSYTVTVSGSTRASFTLTVTNPVP
jgi:thermitase